jgi:hypothetical protein
METIISLIIFSFLLMYINERGIKDKKETIRELTLALKSNNVQEYTEAIPDEEENLEYEADDNMEDIANIDEKVLIKQLEKEYESN